MKHATINVPALEKCPSINADSPKEFEVLDKLFPLS